MALLGVTLYIFKIIKKTHGILIYNLLNTVAYIKLVERYYCFLF